jgi:hypothetical protein
MSINPKRCCHCGKGIMSYLHFFGGQAGYHRFVPEHKHVYKLIPEPKGVFRLQLKIHYLFECRVCKDFQVVQRHFFWHGTPKLPKLVLPKIDYTAMGAGMKKAMSEIGAVVRTPPSSYPSAHYTLRTDGTIEDHTPWLNQGPKNNQNFLGIEGSWRTHD